MDGKIVANISWNSAEYPDQGYSAIALEYLDVRCKSLGVNDYKTIPFNNGDFKGFYAAEL